MTEGDRRTELVERLLAGDRRAAARLMTIVENEAEGARLALRQLYPHTGRAHLIGITGSPGTGKSTLTNSLTKELRRRGKTVGIVAIDPTSSLSGGAVLGDRIRMQDLHGDAGVFIRSMATRGKMGGLARTTNDVVRVLDALGKDIVIIETVGVGQDEVDIARSAHTTILVEVPGLGDDIQSIKAGVLEIADVLVVNKADRDNADLLVSTLRMMLGLAEKREWEIPIIKTVATKDQGTADLADAVERHRAYLEQSGQLHARVREKLKGELISTVRDELTRRILGTIEGNPEIDALLEELLALRLDPHEATQRLLDRLASPNGHGGGPKPSSESAG